MFRLRHEYRDIPKENFDKVLDSKVYNRKLKELMFQKHKMSNCVELGTYGSIY
jgi:hypothetical protein